MEERVTKEINTMRGYVLWVSLSWQQRTMQLPSHSSPVAWGGEPEGKGKTHGLW